MTEKIFIYNLSGVLILDPERTVEYATGLTWSSIFPKGFAEMSCRVRRADVFANWVIKESFTILVKDGGTIVYDGRIQSLPKDIGGGDEFVTIKAVGWYVILQERHIRRRWIDHAALTHIEWPDADLTSNEQNSFVSSKRENFLEVLMGTGDIVRTGAERYKEKYELPDLNYVRRVTFNIKNRTGELIVFTLANDGDATVEFSEGYGDPLGATEAEDVTFVGVSTESFTIKIGPGTSDVFDQSDYIVCYDMVVYGKYHASHPQFAAPNYKQGELIKDITLLLSGSLSVDLDLIGEPDYILSPFTVEKPTPAGEVIDEIASYGDASLNTWGVAVWDRTGTSDNKPKVTFKARSITDYEYQIELSEEELAGLNYERVDGSLFNYTVVESQSNKGIVRYTTPNDDASFKDVTSIANEYQRDALVSIGKADATRIAYIGDRYIQYHKDRVTRGTITVIDTIRTKSGGRVPTNRVRAGERIKLVNTGETFFIRNTSYDAETKTVRISPDEPQDNIPMLLAQVKRGLRQ